jgi:hypothetical protein
MTTTGNSPYIDAEGVVYYNGTGTFSGLDGGTAGNILTSNGTGIAPSFQAAASSGFTPNATIQLQDDFLSPAFYINAKSFLSAGMVIWSTSVAAMTSWASDYTNITNSHPGMIASQTLNSGNTDNGIILEPDPTIPGMPTFILGGGVMTINWVFKIINLSNSTNRYTLRLGIGDTLAADEVNGCYLQYSDNLNSGNWVIKTAASSTRTATNSSTAVTTGFHNCQVTINAAASSISYAVDGTSLGTITTNIPTADVTPFFDHVWTMGTVASGSVSIDLVYLNQTLTTPR